MAMFDWMTWGIWLLGFIILVIWSVVPIREFGEMRHRMKERDTSRATEPPEPPAAEEKSC